jgi:hypothetical protein
MEGPGRPSAASLSVVAIAMGARPEPPAGIPERQVVLWRNITATKPPDWWKEGNLPLLLAYVQAVDTHERLIKEQDAMPVQPVAEFKALAELVVKQAKLLETLATKMRLSQQSMYNEKTAATADRRTSTEKGKPWERSATP